MSAAELATLFRRQVLDRFGAPEDVDLETVTVYFVHQKAYAYSEYDGEPQSFEMNVSWLQQAPDPTAFHPERETPDEDGLFSVRRSLSDEELADFLDTLG